MRKQFAKTMVEVGGDDRLVVMLGDISHFLLRDFEAKYPNRFYNMGIAEQGMIGMAAGAAMNGFFPVVHSIAPFIIERCLEQIKDDLCYQKLGVNLVSCGAAFDYAALGCTHHCYDDVAILRAQPNMQVIVPGSSQEFDALFKETYANGSPTYFRLSEHEHVIATSPKFGEIEKMKDGAKITVAVTGPQLKNAMEATTEMAAKGITCDLLYFFNDQTALGKRTKNDQGEFAKNGTVGHRRGAFGHWRVGGCNWPYCQRCAVCAGPYRRPGQIPHELREI